MCHVKSRRVFIIVFKRHDVPSISKDKSFENYLHRKNRESVFSIIYIFKKLKNRM